MLRHLGPRIFNIIGQILTKDQSIHPFTQSSKHKLKSKFFYSHGLLMQKDYLSKITTATRFLFPNFKILSKWINLHQKNPWCDNCKKNLGCK